MWLRRKRTEPDQPLTDAAALVAHPFSSDRAISSSGEDKLSRKGFAYAIADAIANWRQRDSLVVGIFGPWGVGKTSIVNMVKERLSSSKEPPLIVDFSPWEWTGHQELAEAFFAELEKGLTATGRPAARNVAVKVRSYALALNAGAALAGAVAPVVAAISVLLVVLGIGFVEFGDSAAKWGGRALAGVGAIGVLLAQSQQVMTRLADYLERRSPKSSLSEVKEELADSLRQFGRTIVVVVDDIDRLTPPDTVRMLQIVKANADLPGVVFVVACDQDAVAKAVNTAIGVEGRGYLEKIVQVGFDVPAPDAAELGQLLGEGLDKAIALGPVKARFDFERWRDLNAAGIQPYLTTPRTVIRFVAMAEFALQRYVDGNECNVDPVDFLGIELLREMEPALYQSLRAAKDTITGRTAGDDDELRRRRDAVDPLRAMLEISRPAATRIVRQLFPAMEWILTGTSHHIDRSLLLEGRRVAHDQMFDRYFQFTVPTRDLSDGEISSVVGLAVVDQESLTTALRSIQSRGLMSVFLTRLRAAPSRIPGGTETTFMSGLFDVADDFSGQAETMFTVSDLLQAQFLVEDLLEKLPAADRATALRLAASHSEGVVLPLEVVVLQLHRHDRNRNPLITADELNELGDELVSRVRQLANEEQLLNHRHLVALLYAWDRWAGSEAKAWVEQQASTPSGLATLTVAFHGHGRSDNRHPLVGFIDLEDAKERAREWLRSPDLESSLRGPLEELVSGTQWERLGGLVPEFDDDDEFASSIEEQSSGLQDEDES